MSRCSGRGRGSRVKGCKSPECRLVRRRCLPQSEEWDQSGKTQQIRRRHGSSHFKIHRHADAAPCCCVMLSLWLQDVRPCVHRMGCAFLGIRHSKQMCSSWANRPATGSVASCWMTFFWASWAKSSSDKTPSEPFFKNFFFQEGLILTRRINLPAQLHWAMLAGGNSVWGMNSERFPGKIVQLSPINSNSRQDKPDDVKHTHGQTHPYIQPLDMTCTRMTMTWFCSLEISKQCDWLSGSKRSLARLSKSNWSVHVSS